MLNQSDSAEKVNRRISPALLLAAAIAIGHAIQVSDETYSTDGIHWLGIGIACAWTALFVCEPWPRLVWVVGLGGLGWFYQQLGALPPMRVASTPELFFQAAVPLLLLLAAGAIFAPRWRKAVMIPLFLAGYFSIGVWLLKISPPPQIDVYVLTQSSCQAMSRGVDPYTIDFPLIYTSNSAPPEKFYPPGYVYDGRVHFGYQYMPVSFAVAWAGHLLAGDYRIGNLAAVTAAAGLIAYSGSGALPALAAALILLVPRGFFILHFGWSEPATLVCLAGLVYCAARRPAWLPWVAGLLLASKQHMILAGPALVLLLPKPWNWKTAGGFIAKAAIAAAVVTLPMVLWNVGAFFHSAVMELLRNPFRDDALSFAAAWVRAGHSPPPKWLPYLAWAIACCLVIWRAPRNVSGFCAAMSMIQLSFFALAKQASCNYYFLTIGALCCAVAAGAGAGGGGGIHWRQTRTE